MFEVNANPVFTRKVIIPVPVDGGHDNQSIDVTFRAMSDEEMGDFALTTQDGQKDFLRAAISDMSDLVDKARNPVPYSDAILEHVIGLPYARAPLMKAYTDAIVPAIAGN